MRLVNINDIISEIGLLYPNLKPDYGKLLSDRGFYESFWAGIKKDIIREAIKAKRNYNIYIHNFGGFFNNTYS